MLKMIFLICALISTSNARAAEAPVHPGEMIYREAIITSAAEISTIEVYLDKGAYSIEINGGLERPAVWVGALKMIPDNTDFSIVLASGGGLVDEAEEITESIKNKCHSPDTAKSCTITTLVKSKTSCVSTCTFVFAVGDIRAAGAEAEFGFHAMASFYDFGGAKIAPIERSIEPFRKYSDVSEEWLMRLVEMGVYDKVEITWLYRQDLQDSNFVSKWL